MRLLDLRPKFLRYEERLDTWEVVERQPSPGEDIAHVPHHAVTGMRDYWAPVERLEEAQGIEFLCPKCFVANGGEVGTHAVVCWSKSRGVPDKATPGPGRWVLRGTAYSDLTLDAEPGKSRSVLLLGGCAWHGFITNGDVK